MIALAGCYCYKFDSLLFLLVIIYILALVVKVVIILFGTNMHTLELFYLFFAVKMFTGSSSFSVPTLTIFSLSNFVNSGPSFRR